MFTPEIDLDRGTHVCHFYESHNELKEVALPFVYEGLAKGEHCLYVTAEDNVDEWYFEFQAFGIDVRDALERGALSVIGARQWRRGNSVTRARDTLRIIDSKLVDFTAVRIAGDPDWQGSPPLSAADLCHWEATANLVFDDLDVRTICQYDLRRYSAPILQAALRTHRQVLHKGRRLDNPHYEAPRILENEPHLNDCAADAEAVDRMLAALALPA